MCDMNATTLPAFTPNTGPPSKKICRMILAQVMRSPAANTELTRRRWVREMGSRQSKTSGVSIRRTSPIISTIQQSLASYHTLCLEQFKDDVRVRELAQLVPLHWTFTVRCQVVSPVQITASWMIMARKQQNSRTARPLVMCREREWDETRRVRDKAMLIREILATGKQIFICIRSAGGRYEEYGSHCFSPQDEEERKCVEPIHNYSGIDGRMWGCANVHTSTSIRIVELRRRTYCQVCTGPRA